MQRPLELKLAVGFSSLVAAENLLVTFLSRAALGDGWILLMFFRTFVSIVIAVLLILAYNGNRWIRFIHAGFWVLGMIAIASTDPRLIRDYWVFGGLVLNALAIAFWFHPKTNEWYRRARRVVPAA